MNMKRVITAILAVILTFALGSTAFAAPGKWMQSEGGWWYQNGNGSFPAGKWEQIDGSWYHFDGDGYMDTGWIYDNAWYYCLSGGQMADGWQKIDGSWYYFRSNGKMVTGWEYIDETWYYFRPDGALPAPISYGDEGEDVWYMQKELSRLGYLSSNIDGSYGKMTYAAVIAFKSAHGESAPNGDVDARTMEMMYDSNTYFRPVDEYSSYNQILTVQYALMNYGMITSASGVYDEETKQAILELQSVYGLYESGICDMNTMVILFNLPYHSYPGYDVQWYGSYTNWLIYVNSTANMLYVYYGDYGNWRLQRSWSVTCGAPETPTVLGEYSVYSKGYSFGEGFTCYYYSAFYEDYLFHSTLYWEDTFIPMDPTLGQNLSHGCVRMSLENAKWIYDNIPYGTKVVIVR